MLEVVDFPIVESDAIMMNGGMNTEVIKATKEAMEASIASAKRVVWYHFHISPDTGDDAMDTDDAASITTSVMAQFGDDTKTNTHNLKCDNLDDTGNEKKSDSSAFGDPGKPPLI